MSLENVYYWAKDSWKKITAEELEEFVKNNPDIKVPAKARYFWCEMCGQYVTLANGEINKPHFRHSSAELKKVCKDRSKNFYKDDWLNNPKPMHSLPLKICVDVEQKIFRFQVGLIRLPSELCYKTKKSQIKIKSGKEILCHKDLLDYPIEDKTTWIDIKDIPAEFYSLTLNPEISGVNFYWNEKINGVSLDGTLFDQNTGRRLSNDSDVKVNSKYFLLLAEGVCAVKGVIVKKLLSKNVYGRSWRLYEVEATELSEVAAKFFLKYHCRLTVKPISIVPIYPVHTQNDDIVHCNSSRVIFYFSGNAKIKFFPFAKISYLSKENDFKIIEAELDERYQMMAAGRSELLQYTYVWKDLSALKMEVPQMEVTDIKSEIISAGVSHILPKNSILQIKADFDGKVLINVNSVIKEKRIFKAGIPFDVKNITFGTEIKIFQGLDCVWEISYKREEKGNSKDDTELFLKLERGKGRKMQIPHTWGSLADKLKNYPKVQNWLYKSIRLGFVYEEPYLLFRQFILKVV